MIVEFFIFPFLPFLDVPYIEWAKILGIETDEMYKNGFISEFDSKTPLY
jgi:hypothetical protein